MAVPIETGRLYDPTGTLLPLTAPAPKSEGMAMVPEGVDYAVQDRYRDYPSRNLTPAKLVAILDAADAGEPLEWMQLCEEMLEKDPKLQSIAGTRKKAVLGINHEIRPAELDDDAAADQPLADEIAKFCNAAFVRGGGHKLIGHMMDSIGKGIAVDWVDWIRDKDGRWVPGRFRRIPSTHLRWGTSVDSIRVWQPSNPTAASFSGGEIGVPFEPYTTVRALDDERADHPTRGGLLRTSAWYYLFKNTSLKDWVQLNDRFGIPQRILALPEGDFSNDELYSKAREALRSIGASATGIIKTDWILTLASAIAKGGADLFKTLIDDINTALAQLWLGHELSSQGSKGGGQLGISAANQVRQDYLEGDCNGMSENIRRDVLTPMVGWNWGWDKLHLLPNSIFDYEPPKDVVARANEISVYAKTFPTMPFSLQQLRAEGGFDEPIDDEDDSITAGVSAAGGGNPVTIPDVPATVPDVSINARLDANRQHARPRQLPRSSPSARQKVVDRLTTKAVQHATVETTKLKTQLRAMIREGNAEGLSVGDMAHRISKAYPDLDVDRLDSLLKESQILVRLFGRNA